LSHTPHHTKSPLGSRGRDTFTRNLAIANRSRVKIKLRTQSNNMQY